MTCQRL